jgi:Zn-dependent protease
MLQQIATPLYAVSTWVIPLVIAITFHEASHGYVARLCGDDTAWRLGRVSFNPLKHIDPFGTVLLPALLLLVRSPILFGYAKPVPVNFQALRNPRRDTILVAAAGPGMNLALATLAALAFHFLIFLPDTVGPWVADNLKNALVINVLLAIFNLLPLPPLDGGRIVVAVLPEGLAKPLARLAPYGMTILIVVLFILPLLGAQLGIDLNVVWQLVERSTKFIINAILWLTGNAQWSADRVSGTFDDCHAAFSWAHPAYLAIFPDQPLSADIAAPLCCKRVLSATLS